MATFAELTQRVDELLCPQCGTASLHLVLRCDFGDRECLTVAVCSICHKQSAAEALATFSERYDSLMNLTQREACPACGEGYRTVQATCDRLARECFFIISCPGCGQTHVH